jgi:23S rRNA pseudouridine1911/1915/1917 synthase
VAEPAPEPPRDLSFISEASDEGNTLAAALRARLTGQSWNAVRRLCETGKVRVGGTVVLDPAQRLERGAEISLKLTARRPHVTVPGFTVVYEDPHLIIIEKPSGVSSVPYEAKETGTAMDLIRDHWRHATRRAAKHALFVVHRLDKDTSGLLCFAKTRAAERGLHTIFQNHLAARSYLALAEGAVSPARIESRLVADRGDGLRGSTRNPANPEGQRAVTHVDVIERLPDTTLCRITLETGRTHQIRIHLSERGHPIVGDTVYCRDLLRSGRRPIPSPRLMLHARQLGFDHPIERKRLDFSAEPPDDFAQVLAERRAARAPR